MDYSVVARDILEEVGGEANIVNVSHCMTRLRLTLKDESVVSDENVKAIKGVVGVMKKAGQYQIVIGNEVSKCYNEFLKLGKFGDQAGSAPAEKGKQSGFAYIGCYLRQYVSGHPCYYRRRYDSGVKYYPGMDFTGGEPDAAVDGCDRQYSFLFPACFSGIFRRAEIRRESGFGHGSGSDTDSP